MNETERWIFNLVKSLKKPLYRDLEDEIDLDDTTRYKIVVIFNRVMDVIRSPFAGPINLAECEVEEEYADEYDIPVLTTD
jgi:hypothetical protein